MLVNILLPVYNVDPDMLDECLKSIFSQTFDGWKVIIVDDASTSLETCKYLKTLGEPTQHREVHRLDSNIGEMFARLEGRHYLDDDCKYVAFMDSDDIMLPARLEKQVEFLDDCPKVDILGTQIQRFSPFYINDIQSKDLVTKHPFNVNDCIVREYWSINNPTTMMRREVVEQFDLNSISAIQNSFGISKNTFGDYIFYLINVKKGVQVRNLSEVLLLYRVHGGQLSGDSEYQNNAHKEIRKGLWRNT